MTELAVNWWAVAIAAIAAFLIGGLWYGPLFSRAWLRASGVTEEQARTGTARVFLSAFLITTIMAIVLAAFIGTAGVIFGATAGFLTGFVWVSGAIGVNYLFEHRNLPLFLINAGYYTLTFTTMGAILGALQT